MSSSSEFSFTVSLLRGVPCGPRQAVLTSGRNYFTAVTAVPRQYVRECSAMNALHTPGVCFLMGRTMSMDLFVYVLAARDAVAALNGTFPFEEEGLYWTEAVLAAGKYWLLQSPEMVSTLANRLYVSAEASGRCVMVNQDDVPDCFCVPMQFNPNPSEDLDWLFRNIQAAMPALGYDIFSPSSIDSGRQHTLFLSMTPGLDMPPAYAMITGGGIQVLAGSHAAAAPADTPCRWLLEEPFVSAVDPDGWVLTDMAFPTPRHATLFVTGGRSSDPALWKDPGGVPFFTDRFSRNRSAPVHPLIPADLTAEPGAVDPELDCSSLRSADIDQQVYASRLPSDMLVSFRELRILPSGRILAPAGTYFGDICHPAIPDGILGIRMRILSQGKVSRHRLTVPLSFSSLDLAAAVLSGGMTLPEPDSRELDDSFSTLSPVLSKVIFALTDAGEGIQAVARWDSGMLKILKGSTLSSELRRSCPWNTMQLRQQMEADGRIQNGTLKEDVSFRSVVDACSFVRGRSGGSWNMWSDISGFMLGDYLNELQCAEIYSAFPAPAPVEYPPELQSLEVSLEQDDVEAFGYPAASGFVVKKDSEVTPVVNRSSLRNAALRRKLVHEGKISGGLFTQDVLFPSHSTAAGCIFADRTKVPQWKASNGVLLTTLMKQLSTGGPASLPGTEAAQEGGTEPAEPAPADTAPVIPEPRESEPPLPAEEPKQEEEENAGTGEEQEAWIPPEEELDPMLASWSWSQKSRGIPGIEDEHEPADSLPIFPDGVVPEPGVFYLCGNTCFASGVPAENGFIVHAGSSIAPGLTSLASRRIQMSRINLRRQGVLSDFVFTEDTFFPSPDAAAECISGITGPSLPAWVDMDGRPLWDIDPDPPEGPPSGPSGNPPAPDSSGSGSGNSPSGTPSPGSSGSTPAGGGPENDGSGDTSTADSANQGNESGICSDDSDSDAPPPVPVPVLPPVPSAVLYDTPLFIRSGETEAEGVLSQGGSFTVRSGSRMSPDSHGLTEFYEDLRQKLVSSGKVKDGLFTTDVVFSSISAATCCVTGLRFSGHSAWHDASGHTVEDLRKEYEQLTGTTLKHPKPRVSPDQMAGIEFFLKQNGITATARFTNKGFTVSAGSQMCPAVTTCPPHYAKQRQELIDSGAVVNFVFIADTVFKSVSAATCCILGISRSGYTLWADFSGKTLKAYRDEQNASAVPVP